MPLLQPARLSELKSEYTSIDSIYIPKPCRSSMSVYDSDDAVPKSPPLRPLLAKEPSPESSLPQDILDHATLSESDSSSTGRKRRRRQRRVDKILVQCMSPDQPEIARAVGGSGSDTDSSPSSSEPPASRRRKTSNMETETQLAQPRTPFIMSDMRARRLSPKQPVLKHPPQPFPNNLSRAPVTGSPRRSKPEASKDVPVRAERPSLPDRRSSRSQTRAELQRQKSSQQKLPTISTFDARPKRPRPVTNNSDTRPTSTRRRGPSPSVSSSDGSIATSRNLQQHLIDATEAPHDLKLPPLTDSPIDLSPIPSLHNEGITLPPLDSLTRSISDTQRRPRTTSNASIALSRGGTPPRSAQPSQRFLSPFQEYVYRPSPTSSVYDASSPGDASAVYSPHEPKYGQTASSPFHHHHSVSARARAATMPTRYSSPGRSTAGPTSVPSMSISGSTSTDGRTPSTKGCTPSTMPTPSDRQTSVETAPTPPHSYTQYQHAPVGGYRCEFPGCDAQPFSTLYLLNSHANVHTEERPHFCEVEGCARSKGGKDGSGGKGFKRKNEMIRHGLVHESPGYVCPFCPEKEHRYPRPDNLQRHVRMHHSDKDRDDPMLREILTKRATTTAQTRGRKKRT